MHCVIKASTAHEIRVTSDRLEGLGRQVMTVEGRVGSDSGGGEIGRGSEPIPKCVLLSCETPNT
jgi:hypothetical protein